MQVERFHDVEVFAARAETFLLAREAEHNLMLGIISTLRRFPEQYAHPVYLGVATERDEVVAVAMRTPPQNVALSLAHPESLTGDAALALAIDVHHVYGDGVPGVTGPVEFATAFAHRWHDLTDRTYRVVMSERIYQLERVMPVTGVPGTLREAEERDVPLLAEWVEAFQREALPHEEHIDGKAWARRRIASPLSHTYLWEVDGKPVTMVGCGSPTAHGIRIAPVYTPPELRGHGYGSACVAAVSQRQLDAGRRYCFLYTDLSNPTSNHIYQVVGYQPVSDSAMYAFGIG